jgi:hypothetical protein
MTPQQLTALRAEIQGDPKSVGYGQWLPNSPGMVVDLINAATFTAVKSIKTTTAQAWAATGPMSRIVDAAEKGSVAGADHACRASCLTVLRSFSSGVDIHLERADMQAMLSAWVATGICTAGERDDLLARALQPASRAEVLGLPHVTVYDLIDSGVI